MLLKRAALFIAVVMAGVFAASHSCEAATVQVHVRPASCPSGYSNCCIQTGTKGEDSNGNPYVDQGDMVVWEFPASATQASLAFSTTNCPYSTASACTLSSSTSYTVSATSSVGTATSGYTWPYTSLSWASGANSCSNVFSPSNPGTVKPPGIVMRPPSVTAKGSKKTSKKPQ